MSLKHGKEFQDQHDSLSICIPCSCKKLFRKVQTNADCLYRIVLCRFSRRGEACSRQNARPHCSRVIIILLSFLRKIQRLYFFAGNCILDKVRNPALRRITLSGFLVFLYPYPAPITPHPNVRSTKDSRILCIRVCCGCIFLA